MKLRYSNLKPKNSLPFPSGAPGSPVDCVPVLIKINPRDIVYIQGIIEAYDNLAVPRTLDSRNGILELLASPFFLEDLNEVLLGLSEELPLEILTVPS